MLLMLSADQISSNPDFCNLLLMTFNLNLIFETGFAFHTATISA